MANRRLRQFQYSLENKVVNIFGKVEIGAAGAPTISAADSKGIASIARNSAGKYTITLEDYYVKFLGIEVSQLLAAGTPAASSSVQCVVRSVSPQSAKTVVIEFVDNAGAAIELTNGSTLYIHAKFNDSTV